MVLRMLVIQVGNFLRIATEGGEFSSDTGGTDVSCGLIPAQLLGLTECVGVGNAEAASKCGLIPAQRLLFACSGVGGDVYSWSAVILSSSS